MILEIIDDNGFLPDGAAELIEKTAETAEKTEGVTGLTACLTIVDGEDIRALNKRMRNVDSETDVLSFPTVKYNYPLTARDSADKLKRAYDPDYDAPFIGDIVLNVSRAREQAEEFGHSLAREMGYLTCHAMFHLMGYDHMNDIDKPKMREMEKKVMAEMNLLRFGEEA